MIIRFKFKFNIKKKVFKHMFWVLDDWFELKHILFINYIFLITKWFVV